LRDRLAEILDTDLAGDLALDTSGVTFLDSIGLSLFVRPHDQLAARDRRLVLFCPTSMARRLLGITGLDDGRTA
jgi:anti-anti-sigma factor